MSLRADSCEIFPCLFRSQFVWYFARVSYFMIFFNVWILTQLANMTIKRANNYTSQKLSHISLLYHIIVDGY